MHGGAATPSKVLPYVGTSAAEVVALPDVVVTVDCSGETGHPATVFTLREDDYRHAEEQEAKPEPAPDSRPADVQWNGATLLRSTPTA